MADKFWIADRTTEDEAERRIIRRFTDELNGDNELERATKDAQQRRDEDEKAAFETRMRSYFDETSEESSQLDFSIAETARKELEAICKEIAKEEKTSKLARISSRFGKQKKSAKDSANELIAGSVYHDFGELQMLVEGQESRWKATHGVVYRNFQRLCKNLDAHKKVFGIFPSQNMYTQVFCGSLALIVEAAVNHDEIAEMLSHSVTEISMDASRCAQLVDLIRTQQMREQLSKVYAQVFRFYRDALEWFMKSKTSRFLGSFNERIKANFEDSVKNINKSIKRMYRDCHIGMAAMLHVVHRDTAVSKAEIFRQRQAPVMSAFDPGELMQEFLKAMAHYQTIENANSARYAIESPIKVLIDSRVSPGDSLTREKAREAARHLEDYLVGDEGHALFDGGQFWMPNGEIAHILHDWMSSKGSAQGRTLWISSPATPHKTTSAKAAAMNAVLAAWQAKAPVISHFCERPRWSYEDQTPEEAGIVGLVYSLILQLLQFNVEGEEFDLDVEAFRGFDGTNRNFADSLEVLKKLLTGTPLVAYCVIYGINGLEWGDGAEWCHSLLDILLEHQKDRNGSFNILLATSGQSRVLPEHVANEDHFFAGSTARQILRMI